MSLEAFTCYPLWELEYERDASDRDKAPGHMNFARFQGNFAFLAAPSKVEGFALVWKGSPHRCFEPQPGPQVGSATGLDLPSQVPGWSARRLDPSWASPPQENLYRAAFLQDWLANKALLLLFQN